MTLVLLLDENALTFGEALATIEPSQRGDTDQGGRMARKNLADRGFRWLVAPAVVSMMCSGTLIAQASSAPPDNANTQGVAESVAPLDVNDLTDWFDAYGVDMDTQGQLLNTLESGGVWDSMRPGAVPVHKRSIETESEFEEVWTYEDGSILVEAVEIPVVATRFSVMAVGQCRTYSTGSGYRNAYDCQASGTTGVVTMGMYISYTLVQGGPDTIMAAHSPYGHANGGTLFPNPPTIAIPRKTESGANPAYASMTSTYKSLSGGGSTNLDFRANVAKDAASTRWAVGF